nr:hypothetical protein [uncultured Peptostreptococcus sp.]
MGGKIIAQTLLNRNPKKVLINTGPESISIAVNRKNGIIDVFKSHDIKYDIFESKAYDFNAALDLVNFKEGKMNATVAQQPEMIGKLGVQAAFDYFAGKTITPKIASPLKLIVK